MQRLQMDAPAHVLHGRAGHKGDATSGGGVGSAVWAVKVVTQWHVYGGWLQDQCKTYNLSYKSLFFR